MTLPSSTTSSASTDMANPAAEGNTAPLCAANKAPAKPARPSVPSTVLLKSILPAPAFRVVVAWLPSVSACNCDHRRPVWYVTCNAT